MTVHPDAPAIELDERFVFLDRLQVVEAASLLQIGTDTDWFAGNGLQVTTAAEGWSHPAESFDAVFAIGEVDLAAVREVLRPGGLLFVGVWTDQEQIFAYVREHFDPVDVHTVQGFQAITAVRPLATAGE
jgi:hypothetical protein